MPVAPAATLVPLESDQPRPVLGHLLRSVDFERVLKTRSRAQTAHFAVHQVADAPWRPVKAPGGRPDHELSTGDAPMMNMLVDNCSVVAPKTFTSSRRWLGVVVPKRHAKRSVTRSLLKREIRAAVMSAGHALEGGMWVVRLRAPFDRGQYPSAASSALQRSARGELDLLLSRVAQRPALV